MADDKIFIDYGKMNDWSQKINKSNEKMDETLKTIQKTIKALEGDYESNAAVTIREKIAGMSPRFEQYHSVVKNFATLLHNIGEQYRGGEGVVKGNAERFI